MRKHDLGQRRCGCIKLCSPMHLEIAHVCDRHCIRELRRFRKKIENQRVIRNEVGRSVLDAFLRDRIVTIKGVFYKLEPEMLDRHLGMSWVDLMKRQTSDRFVEYLRRI